MKIFRKKREKNLSHRQRDFAKELMGEVPLEPRIVPDRESLGRRTPEEVLKDAPTRTMTVW